MVVNLVSIFFATINFAVFISGTVSSALALSLASDGATSDDVPPWVYTWHEITSSTWLEIISALLLVTKILVHAYGLLCVYSFKKQLEVGPMKRAGPNF